MKWVVCSLLSPLEDGDLLCSVRSQMFPQTFSTVRKPARDDFEAANKDDKISRTFFANHQLGAHCISFSLTENDIWPTNFLTAEHGRDDLGEMSRIILKTSTIPSLFNWSDSSRPRLRYHSLASSLAIQLARSLVLLFGRTQTELDPDPSRMVCDPDVGNVVSVW